MNETHKDFLSKISFSVQKPNTISIYRKGVYLFILVFTLLQIPVAKELWSESALLPVKFFDASPFLEVLNLLSHQQFAPYYLLLNKEPKLKAAFYPFLFAMI